MKIYQGVKNVGKLQEALKRIQPVNTTRTNAIQAQLDNLTKPQGSLGRLEELAKKYCLITGKNKPSIKNKIIFTFAGDHGVTEEGVSAFPKDVTPQMVYNFLGGGAGVNVLARHVGARVIVVDMGVDHEFEPVKGLEIRKIGRGTRNMTKGPAMTRDEAERAVLAGIELVEKYRDSLDILGTGDMGIGNTTPSSAIVSVITGTDPEKVTGRGTGIDDRSLRNKVEVIKKAIACESRRVRDCGHRRSRDRRGIVQDPCSRGRFYFDRRCAHCCRTEPLGQGVPHRGAPVGRDRAPEDARTSGADSPA
jgi:nicotinate-nucleotide--dimethylbenzimidazole phosphoribosyltransferase